MFGFVAMAAGTFYFVLQRNDYKPEHRQLISYSATVTFIAAVMYWQMKEIVNFPGLGNPTLVSATMPVRYLDWVLTTPLLLLEFGIIATLAGAAKGITYRLIVADIVMIVTGYLGEIGVAGSSGNYVNFIISSAAWGFIINEIWKIKPSKGTVEIKLALNRMKFFVIFGWAIYPIGTAIQEILEINAVDSSSANTAVLVAAIIYVLADVVNKVGYGLVATTALKKN